MIYIKTYTAPTVREREILRYAGVREEVPEIAALMRDMLAEAEEVLTYKVCYGEFELSCEGNSVDLGFSKPESHALVKALSGCRKAVVFAATVGIGLDRLIARYSTLSPTKALMLQAIGAERIESLCDVFCEDLRREFSDGKHGITTRFSPGYGDLGVEMQTDIFRALECDRKIGLTLNSSMLMSPSKSVTAIVGITDCAVFERRTKSCDFCEKIECGFRRN